MTSKILQLLGNFGGVKTVNGNSPDAAGNVEVEIPEASGGVQTVNGVKPDANGNVDTTKVTKGYYDMVVGVSGISNGFIVKSNLDNSVLAKFAHDGAEVGTSYFQDGMITLNKYVYNGKYARLNGEKGSSSKPSLTLSHDADNVLRLTADGVISTNSGIIKVGINEAFGSIIRFVKAPEEDTDAANKAYVDAKALPTVTTDNNGAFLRVVDGAWAAAAIANAEEASF